MNIRKFELSDLDQIYGIYQKVSLNRNKIGNSEYETLIQKNGFLLGLDTKEDLEKEIDKANYVTVAEENNIIVGYLIADDSDDQKFNDDEYKTWFDNDLKTIYYYNQKVMTLATIAVDPEYGGKGVGKILFEELIQWLKNNNYEYIFSIMTMAPLTNCATVLWHTKMGYKRLAMGRPRKLFNLENYVGILMYKKLQ
ncbi:MAG: GNAT family N-acetyltransferase [Candidatus Shapirobacteria bacterium]